MEQRNLRFLGLTRLLGYLFIATLVAILAISAIPKYYFLVSSRAIINAPVQSIASRISGRVADLDLQIGDSVTPGQRAARIENIETDASIMLSLRLERLQLADRLTQITSTRERTGRQLTFVRAQIAATRQGVIEELRATVRKAESNVRFYEARVGEQQSLLDQKQKLVVAGLLDRSVVAPLEQKLAAATYELESAKGELDRSRAVTRSIEIGDYSGGFATNLMTLEFQEQSLDLENKKAEAELASVTARIDQLERIMSGEQGRLENASSSSVTALHEGRVVSVEVGHGDYVHRGGLVARSLDCSKSFVAAVFAARDVAELEVGTPAVVNIRSLGSKHRGRIAKTIRYFASGSETRYYKAFPEAAGHELYVIIELDRQPGSDGSDDLFFGCHVGEAVSVSLGEPLFDRIVSLFADEPPPLSEEFERHEHTATAALTRGADDER